MFGSSRINAEALSTSQEYEEWFDQTFEDTICSIPLPQLYDQDELIHKEELTMEKHEAAIERFYPVKPDLQPSRNKPTYFVLIIQL